MDSNSTDTIKLLLQEAAKAGGLRFASTINTEAEDIWWMNCRIQSGVRNFSCAKLIIFRANVLKKFKASWQLIPLPLSKLICQKSTYYRFNTCNSSRQFSIDIKYVAYDSSIDIFLPPNAYSRTNTM